MGRKKKRRARDLHGVTSRLESPGTPPMKLSDAEEEDLEEAARRKPWMGNLASSSSSTSARTNNAHEERSRVGGGSDVGGLYKREDFGRSRQMSGAKGFDPFAGWPAPMRLEMKTINALNLQPAVPSAGIKLERSWRKSHQPKRQSLARVDELKAEFPGRRSKDSKLEPLEVNSDSGSVASSDAALRFLQFACLCDSSENEPLESDVPTRRSLTLESDNGDESVGSSSVAEPAIGRRAGAAQDEYACPTESKHAVPSFLTEDPTDLDSDSSEVPCL